MLLIISKHPGSMPISDFFKVLARYCSSSLSLKMINDGATEFTFISGANLAQNDLVRLSSAALLAE